MLDNLVAVLHLAASTVTMENCRLTVSPDVTQSGKKKKKKNGEKAAAVVVEMATLSWDRDCRGSKKSTALQTVCIPE